MKTTITFTFFILLIASLNAETFTEAKLRNFQKKHSLEETFLEMGNSQFGKNLLNMLTLRSQTSQKFEDLNRALTDLITQIQNQQNTEDQEYDGSSGTYSKTIQNQATIIKETGENIQRYEGILRDKKQAQNQKLSAKTQLEAEGEGISEYLGTLAQTRQREKEAYQERVKTSESLIQGLDRTIALFKNQDQNTDIDQDAVQKILALLESIKASIGASTADDSLAEDNAATKYTDFVNNRNARLGAIEVEVGDLGRDLNKLEDEIGTLQTNLDSEKGRKANAEDLKTKTETSLADLTTKYNSNKSVRSNQISLLTQVNVALKNNPSEVQKYLNKY